MNFLIDYTQPSSIEENAIAILFFKDQVLLDNGSGVAAPTLLKIKELDKNWPSSSAYYYLGRLGDLPVYAIELKEIEVVSLKAATFQPLRMMLETVKEAWFSLLCRAKQLLQWTQTSYFCSACGSKTIHSTTETAKICVPCNRIIYPSASPAVIVVVSRGNEILLARSPHFRPGMYSALAGFIEPCESAEQTIHREIKEEVSICVKNLKYFGTQYWPFPNSFMIAYHAEYESGEIQIEPNEIEDARWFTRNNLPNLPYRSSIARKLIDDFLS